MKTLQQGLLSVRAFWSSHILYQQLETKVILLGIALIQRQQLINKNLTFCLQQSLWPKFTVYFAIVSKMKWKPQYLIYTVTMVLLVYFSRCRVFVLESDPITIYMVAFFSARDFSAVWRFWKADVYVVFHSLRFDELSSFELDLFSNY